MKIPLISSYSVSRPQAQCRLFCLPHAGGSMSYYFPWQKLFPESVELILLQLPGRGVTFKEAPITEWPAVIQAVSDTIINLQDGRPFAIFGHSLGALIGFEVAYQLQERRIPLRHLFVSGMSAPHHYKVLQLRYTLSDDELINYVANSDEPAKNKDENYYSYLRFSLPMLRGDFKLVDTYEYQHRKLLACPLSAMYGEQDALYTKDEVLAWKEVSTGDFDFKTFQGGHMYLSSAHEQVIDYLTNALSIK